MQVSTLMEERLDGVDAAFELTVVEPATAGMDTASGQGPVACQFSVLGVS
jgi:hypothetical protein